LHGMLSNGTVVRYQYWPASEAHCNKAQRVIIRDRF